MTVIKPQSAVPQANSHINRFTPESPIEGRVRVVNTKLACMSIVTSRLFVWSCTSTNAVLKAGSHANNCPIKTAKGKPAEKLFMPQQLLHV